MKGINTLIKLSKRKLDELRRDLAKLESQKGQLQEAIKKLAQELEHEMSIATKQVEMSGFFGGFSKRIKLRQEEITKEIKALDDRMKLLSAQITEAFSELKKYEIAKENHRLREEEKAKRRETIMLDEIAGQQFRRKQTENQ